MNWYFHSFHALFNMGGYAAYVWPAYGIVLLVLLYNLFSASSMLRRVFKQLRQQHADSKKT